jgi:uncharacterized SAM-binding protein YcdF (DUF218 family)
VRFLNPPFRKWIIGAALAAILVLSHPLWLAALGQYLVSTDSPVQADMVVVLAGDGYGHRILRASELVRQGLAPTVLVSGPEGLYGYYESELAIPFAVERGYPRSWFLPFRNKALSTREEARAIVPELRKLGVHRCLLVTSDYHTRRSGRIFRSAAPDIDFRLIAARDEFFRPGDWWRSRQGQKQCVLEWIKTITAWFGF